MYVLLYVDSDRMPCYIQGSMDAINETFRTRWVNGDIDKDEWECCDNWQLLGIEDGLLTPMNHVNVNVVPHFEVI